MHVCMLNLEMCKNVLQKTGWHSKHRFLQVRTAQALRKLNLFVSVSVSLSVYLSVCLFVSMLSKGFSCFDPMQMQRVSQNAWRWQLQDRTAVDEQDKRHAPAVVLARPYF